MTPSAALRLLGIRAGADVPAIRKAYAALYKAMDPDADPEGYARLRQARDIALRAAKVAAAPLLPDEPEAPAEPDALPVAPWLYGAPTVAIDQAAEIPLVNARQVPHPEPAPVAPQQIDAPAASAAALRALAGPPLIESAEPLRADIGYLASPDVDLARLLHDPDADLAPLTDDQEAFAQRCLRALLAEAATADLTRHARIEEWLADLFAETWPRSAPLLRSTAEAFGWENERGQITERSSIAWLNARLRGLRFQDKVTEPDHPLHKAWTELTRPGSATIIDKFRVSRSDVNQLIDGVRKHFPELENHFSPERVASWGNGVPRGWKGFGVFRIFGTGYTFNFGYSIAVIVGLQVIMAVLRVISPDPVVDPRFLQPRSGYSAASDPQFEQIRDAAVHEVFGKDKTILWLRQQQPGLATDFEAAVAGARALGTNEQGAIAQAIEFVRRRVLINGFRADEATLRELTRLRLAQLDVARKSGPEACNRFLRAGEVTGLKMPEPLRAQERALSARLAGITTFDVPEQHGPTRTTIPGALVAEVIDTTGMSPKRVSAAFQDQATPSERCAVIGALLQAALKWKGKEQATILRAM